MNYLFNILARAIIYTLLLVLFCILFVVSSRADAVPYISLHIGSSNFEDTTSAYESNFTDAFEFGLAGGLAIGYDMPWIRTEFELAHQYDTLRVTKQDVNSITLFSSLCNIYLDFENTTNVIPYIMVGAGLAHINIEHYSNDIEFAHQLGAGLAYYIDQYTILDLRYRQFKTELSVKKEQISCESQSISFGVRVSF